MPPEFDGPVEGRSPCPKCGTTGRKSSRVIHDRLQTKDSVRRGVTRGLNDTRVNVLFVLIAIGVGVGATAGFEENSVLVGVAFGFGAFILATVLLTLIYRWPWLRAKVMAAMHLVTGK